jgi:Rad3-related DNA helicase
MQRPLDIPTEPVPKDSPPTRPSLENQEPDSWYYVRKPTGSTHPVQPPLGTLTNYSTRKEELRRSLADKPRSDRKDVTRRENERQRSEEPTFLEAKQARHQPNQSPRISIEQSDSIAPQPSTLHTASDPSILFDLKSSACRRLISHTLSPHETISLIKAIFTSEAETNVIRDLRGDDAQTFIDVVYGVRFHNFISFSRHLLIAFFALISHLPLTRL